MLSLRDKGSRNAASLIIPVKGCCLHRQAVWPGLMSPQPAPWRWSHSVCVAHIKTWMPVRLLAVELPFYHRRLEGRENTSAKRGSINGGFVLLLITKTDPGSLGRLRRERFHLRGRRNSSQACVLALSRAWGNRGRPWRGDLEFKVAHHFSADPPFGGIPVVGLSARPQHV